MSEHELAMLLTRITTIDHRVVDRLTLEAWQPMMATLPFEDAERAVNEHYAETGDWLMPHHIATRCRRYAEERARELDRARRYGNTVDVSVDKPPYFAEMMEAARQATLAAVAAGHTHGSQVARDSARRAAEEVQARWERGAGETWQKPAPAPTLDPATLPTVEDPAKARMDRDDEPF